MSTEKAVVRRPYARSAFRFSEGGCYYNGEGVVKDLAEAAKWFRMSAEQGIALAHEKLREIGK